LGHVKNVYDDDDDDDDEPIFSMKMVGNIPE